MASRISLKLPDVIFDLRNEILTPKKHIYRNKWRHIVFDLFNCTRLASRISLQRPPDTIILDLRIKILTLTNLYLDIHVGTLCDTSKSLPGWPTGSAVGGLQEPPGNSSCPLVCHNIGNCYYLCFLPCKKYHLKANTIIFSVFTWNSGAGRPVEQPPSYQSPNLFPYTCNIYSFW